MYPPRRILSIPDKTILTEHECAALPYSVESTIWQPSKVNATITIYNGLLNHIEKPHNISDIRFQKILKIKAILLDIFLHRKEKVDAALDTLELACAMNMRASGFSTENLWRKKLCPHEFYIVPSKNMIPGHPMKKNSHFPVISAEIMKVQYPIQILTLPLKKQLQQNGINIRASKNFFDSDSWHTLFGAIPTPDAQSLIGRGIIFTEALGFPDNNSRTHAAYSHAIQEYVISKLLENNALGDLSVPNETDLTELELLKADSWLIKDSKDSNPYKEPDALFDIMREKYNKKFFYINFYPSNGYCFTSADFVNDYLMLSSIRFPVLSTLLYSQYASETFIYFDSPYVYFNRERNLLSFKELSPEEQLAMVNYHFTETNVPVTFTNLFPQHQDKFIPLSECKDKTWITLKRNSLDRRLTFYCDDSIFAKPTSHWRPVEIVSSSKPKPR